MTSNANTDEFTLSRIRGPAMATVPPGRDPRQVSGQVRLPALPRMITGCGQETSRG
jgi:hypothetical protein